MDIVNPFYYTEHFCKTVSHISVDVKGHLNQRWLGWNFALLSCLFLLPQVSTSWKLSYVTLKFHITTITNILNYKKFSYNIHHYVYDLPKYKISHVIFLVLLSNWNLI
jgi:hypothetical protein